MSAAAGGAAAAAAAVAAAAALARQEKEMTTYTPEDLAGDWEFKILRSSFTSFGKPASLERVLAEERRAGWVLVEKFDDYRIRLKRPAAMRKGDAALGFDAYRTTVDQRAVQRNMLIMVGIIVAIGALTAILMEILD